MGVVGGSFFIFVGVLIFVLGGLVGNRCISGWFGGSIWCGRSGWVFCGGGLGCHGGIVWFGGRFVVFGVWCWIVIALGVVLVVIGGGVGCYSVVWFRCYFVCRIFFDFNGMIDMCLGRDFRDSWDHRRPIVAEVFLWGIRGGDACQTFA